MSDADSVGHRSDGGGGGGGVDDDGDNSLGKKALSLARPDNSSLFVRNVADRTTVDDLRILFRYLSI